eukprot:360784-Chlamydomonas_euryale.AAC.2
MALRWATPNHTSEHCSLSVIIEEGTFCSNLMWPWMQQVHFAECGRVEPTIQFIKAAGWRRRVWAHEADGAGCGCTRPTAQGVDAL